MSNLPKGTPAGLQYDRGLIYGHRASHPGLFEIKFHVPKTRNAITADMQKKLCEVIKIAEDDEEIKCIMLHGGKYFTSGNDINVFKLFATDMDAALKMAKWFSIEVMPKTVVTLASSKKPIIAVVRGGAVGIGFTALSHVSMVYCTPEAFFSTPFMESG